MMEQLQECLDKNQYVECVKVGQEDFKNYGKMEDAIYKTAPLSGHMKRYQLFYSTAEHPGILFAKESNMSVKVHKMDLRKGKEQGRNELLADFDVNNMEILNDVEGIRTIKQVELYTKWRKHVPEEYKSPLYDNPGEDVLQSVKEDRKNKKQYIENNRLKRIKVE
jgi:hypothetical protein